MKDFVDALVRKATTSMVVLLQLALGLATGVSAWLLGWEAAVTGLALMHLVAVVIMVGPWPGRAHNAAETKQLRSLERRLDSLSARVVAGAERTRVDILDAVVESRDNTGNHRS